MSRCLVARDAYPSNTVAVLQAEWRAEFYELKSGTQEAKKKAFQRAETDLLALKVITRRHGLVWLGVDSRA